MEHRIATAKDLALLARLNHELMVDEGHRNPRDEAFLCERMEGWTAGEYTAVLFEEAGDVVAYAVFRPTGEGMHLRQFFVCRHCRRRGYGRAAMRVLLERVWQPGTAVLLDVNAGNDRALAFWRSLGFEDLARTLHRPDGK